MSSNKLRELEHLFAVTAADHVALLASIPNWTAMVTWLCKIHAATYNERNFLRGLVERNSHRTMTEILRHCDEVDFNAVVMDKRTALLHAMHLGRIYVVRVLMAHADRRNVNVNAVDAAGRTVLHIACHMGHVGIVPLLLNCKAIDVNARDNNDISPLVMAVISNRSAVVRLMMNDIRVDVNAENRSGFSAMQTAVSSDFGDVVEAMLCARVDLSSTNCFGSTALDRARGPCKQLIVNYMKKNDITIEKRPPFVMERSDNECQHQFVRVHKEREATEVHAAISAKHKSTIINTQSPVRSVLLSSVGQPCLQCHDVSRPVNARLLPCRHRCLCATCAMRLKRGGRWAKCPDCQQPVKKIVKC